MRTEIFNTTDGQVVAGIKYDDDTVESWTADSDRALARKLVELKGNATLEVRAIVRDNKEAGFQFARNPGNLRRTVFRMKAIKGAK